MLVPKVLARETIREMNVPDPTGTDWTKREIDLVVADYFDMLRLELLRRPYVKAHRNAALRELIGRSRGSIEFKHQNISAVLQTLGRTWISGYKPRANIQRALVAGVERYLVSTNDTIAAEDAAILSLEDEIDLFLEAAPSLVPLPAAAQPPAALNRLVRKFDPAARDARNRTLGRCGEERILRFEHARLTDAGRSDLARRVKWVSEEEGDGAGYDVLSFDPAGSERLLEVKTTAGYQRTPFYLTENERALSTERPDEFRLVRLYDFLRAPKAFELAPPLADSVILRPINYRASFA